MDKVFISKFPRDFISRNMFPDYDVQLCGLRSHRQAAWNGGVFARVGQGASVLLTWSERSVPVLTSEERSRSPTDLGALPDTLHECRCRRMNVECSTVSKVADMSMNTSKVERPSLIALKCHSSVSNVYADSTGIESWRRYDMMW